MPDTIFALSSGHVPSGVAVLRLSGPAVKDVLIQLAGHCPPARTAALRQLRLPDSTRLDQGLVLYFQAPHSFTGEDIVELHLHGGRAVVAKALAFLGSMPGLRQADAGEFTRRAFLNGKLDLVEVEGLADLLTAETEMQRRFALENSSGAQSLIYEDWRQRLVHARAMIEAELDFSDEGDVPGSVAAQVWSDVALLKDALSDHVKGFARAEIMRDGLKVVLTGPPNAGKSSLLNALARRDVAIVSEIPGTTRDVIEVAMDIEGYRIALIDTAGLRSDASGVEALGIARAEEKISSAHVVLSLTAPDQNLTPIEAAQARIFRVSSKSDIGARVDRGDFDFRVSSRSGDGIDELLKALGAEASRRAGDFGETLPSRQRHVDLINLAAATLDCALNETIDIELRAEALRGASQHLGEVVGKVGTEEVLGHIFSNFCIGK